jgi:alcohol dehydrogenase
MSIVARPPGPRRGRSPRHRPRGWIRHYAGLLGPGAADATRASLERNRDQRLARLVACGRDRLRERARPSRRRMRALVAYPGGRISWRRVPAPPPPGATGAIVCPIAIATCDMDPLIALGASPFPLPLHLGHECVAEVLSVGAEVAAIRPGQRVVVPFQISCGTCGACTEGRTSNCTTVPPVSMYGFGLAGGLWGGALADELAVPYADAMLVPLPDGIDPAAAASVADNVCDAYRHVAPHLRGLLRRDPEARVLILGALDARSRYSASVPLYTALIARSLGARRPLVVDARRYARAHAERLGIEALPASELGGVAPAPLVVDLTTTGDGLATAISSTAPDGVCSSAGSLHRTARIPFLVAYAHNLTLHISRVHARSVIPEILDLMRAGRLHPEEVTTTVASIDDAPAALREHYTAGAVKTIVTA